MNMTDPIADMLTRIRNGLIARKQEVEMPTSKIKQAIALILKEEGYIKGFEITQDGKLKVVIKYSDKRPVLTNLKRVSKPGLRVYTKRDSIPRVRGGMGTAILSTPMGVMTGTKAYHTQTGGEVICYVW